jgi:hypothetical protein
MSLQIVNNLLYTPQNATPATSGSVNLADGNWHHVAVCSVPGTNNTIGYVDTVQQWTCTLSYTSGQTTNFNVGAYNGAVGGTGFNGEIVEMRVWNVAQSQTKLATNWKTKLNPNNYPNLMGYWPYTNYNTAIPANGNVFNNVGNAGSSINLTLSQASPNYMVIGNDGPF